MVYVYNGKRYTFEHSWTRGLQIFFRPKGTSYPDVLADVMDDSNMDGFVDFGSDGHGKIFRAANYRRDGSPAKGTMHKPHWQAALNEALIGLAATIE